MSALSVGWRREVEQPPRMGGLTDLLVGDPDPRSLLGILSVTGSAHLLETAQRAGLLEWRADRLRAVPMGPGCPMPDFRRTPTTLTLSRFALLRRDGERWCLESGRVPWSIEVSPTDAERLMSGAASDDEATLLSAVGLFADDDAQADHWQLHERYFYLRSQPRFALSPPRRDTAPPPELVRDRFPLAERVTLPAPAHSDTGASHFAITATRRTHREFASIAVSLDQLGGLLWHTLRVRYERPRDVGDHTSYDALFRPVPSGGAMHAIDTWVYSRDVEGLPEQWWWYDPFTHALASVPTITTNPGLATPDSPVHMVFTVRHERESWKYAALAHSLELKDVGVIMHAIQLAAQVLGLGVWLVGASDIDGLTEALGLDAESDTPLGELALGVPSGSSAPVV